MLWLNKIKKRYMLYNEKKTLFHSSHSIPKANRINSSLCICGYVYVCITPEIVHTCINKYMFIYVCVLYRNESLLYII